MLVLIFTLFALYQLNAPPIYWLSLIILILLDLLIAALLRK